MSEKKGTTSTQAQDGGHKVPVIQDWAHLVAFEPNLYFRPQNVDELKNYLTTLQRGSLGKRRVRVLGSRHSCSKIFTSDAILDVSGMPRTLEFNQDHSAVTATANWRLHDFLLELSKRGKSLPATGGTDEQTLAGLISTNTAPATPKHTVYETVEWIEYLTLDAGSQAFVERRVSRKDPDFVNVICSLGAIGLLTKVRFQLIDEPFFATIQKVVPLQEVLANLERTSKEYDFWRIDWIPDSEQGLLWAATRIPKEKADPNGDYPTDKSEGILELIFTKLDDLIDVGPLLNPAMELVYKVVAATYGETVATGPLRNMLPVDRRAPLRVAMAEWGFNPSDLNRVLQLCRDYFKKQGWPNLPVEIELTKTDNYSMSAWNWDGLDYIVKFNFMYLTDVCKTDADKEQIYAHLKGIWGALVRAGIPFKAHWGKINFMTPAFVRERYHFDRFEPLINPMFLNDYLAERLPPVAK